MELEEFKQNIAYNLIWFRKKNGLTQLQLAEKLNYSDKAISKWERAESLPDAFTLQQIAEFYGITLDDFLVKERKAPIFNTGKKKFIISIMSATLVWVVAAAIYMIVGLVFTSIKEAWFSFVWAVPVTGIVLLVFSCLWGKHWMQFASATLILWGITLGLYATFETFMSQNNLWWLFFIAAIPVQLLFVLWLFLKRTKKNKNLE
jgi:transcriptional regulator with XRE-family HTH domain